MAGIDLFLALLAAGLAVALLLAQMRLFSIDRTLKEILAQLEGRRQAEAEIPPADEPERSSAPITLKLT